MIKNLYILHTQYNIILGTSIKQNRFESAQNDLIILAEFKVSAEYAKILYSLFDRVVFLKEEFEPIRSKVKCEIDFAKKYSTFKHSFASKEQYDNVFISQDQPLDCLIYGSCLRNNKACKCYNIEEDVYYSLLNRRNDLSYIPKKQIPWVHILRKLLYGKRYLFETGYRRFSGQSSFFDGYFVLYPNLVREQLRTKNKYEISKEALVNGINAIYKDKIDIPKADKFYLFFFDLLERYSNPEGIKRIVSSIVIKARMEKAVMLLKFHPRETNKFDIGDGIEIPSIVPAEKLLSALNGSNVTVFGNATTSIIVANKIGFKTISVAKINGSDNLSMLEKFSEMGILVPSSIEEI